MKSLVILDVNRSEDHMRGRRAVMLDTLEGIEDDLAVVAIRIGWIPPPERNYLENLWRALCDKREQLVLLRDLQSVHPHELEEDCERLRGEVKGLLARSVRAARELSEATIMN